jgi:NhaP-type Na+/H+ or K+/H+ antiporter
LRVLLEGEALLNDASSFTLFEIFLHLVEQLNSGAYDEMSGWSVFGEIVKSALKLAGGKKSSVMKGLYRRTSLSGTKKGHR